MNRALVIVDVQHDFCEGGSLPVHGGIEVAKKISEYVRERGADYTVMAATADWHEEPGSHWSDNPDFEDSWPVHCKIGTTGAEFRPEIEPALASVQAVFRKGEFVAAYSGFEGSTQVDGEVVQLAAWLHEHEVEAVDVVGLATDYCVRATALDAALEGFQTRVLLDLTAGVDEETTRAALERFNEEGIEVAQAFSH